MLVGRLLGWSLLGLALLMAGADLVLAMAPIHCPTIAIGEVFTLLTGTIPHPSPDMGGAALVKMPAWVGAGVTGTGLCAACRRRRRRRWFRR